MTNDEQLRREDNLQMWVIESQRRINLDSIMDQLRLSQTLPQQEHIHQRLPLAACHNSKYILQDMDPSKVIASPAQEDMVAQVLDTVLPTSLIIMLTSLEEIYNLIYNRHSRFHVVSQVTLPSPPHLTQILAVM